jgi:hypothetical protein
MMSVRRNTRPGSRWLVRGLIGATAALTLAGCASSAASPSAASSPASSSPASSSPAAASPAASSKAAPAVAAAKPRPASAPAAPASAPKVDAGIEVYGNCKAPSVEPAEIVLACADYNAILESLHWTSWTATSATAVGTFVYNDCTPNCAEGHFHHVPGTRVTLTVPVRSASGQQVWSQVQESPEPPGYATGPYHGGPQPLPNAPI